MVLYGRFSRPRGSQNGGHSHIGLFPAGPFRLEPMSRPKLIAAVVGVLVVLAGIWYFARGRSAPPVIELLDAQPVEKRSFPDGHAGFTVETVTIDGQAKRCLLARPFARLIYQVTVPSDGWLEAAFALKPEAWTQATDGAQFRIGIAEGRTYDELLRQVVVPARGDRRWFTVRLDLSAYQGHTVRLIFNTDPGPPGSKNAAFDETVWCEPRITSHR
jgi:hypothetical protein